MKKKSRYLVLLFALMLLLSACSSKDSTPYTTADAGKLLDAGVFSGEMEEVDLYIVSLLYGLSEDSILDGVSYMAINASVSADELTILIMEDENAAKDAEEACQKRVENQIQSYQSYGPDQVPRLEEAVILRRENTVLFAVGDPESLTEALSDLDLGS